jgi:hypothetical protein
MRQAGRGADRVGGVLADVLCSEALLEAQRDLQNAGEHGERERGVTCHLEVRVLGRHGAHAARMEHARPEERLPGGARRGGAPA